jgi:hypothetical protein
MLREGHTGRRDTGRGHGRAGDVWAIDVAGIWLDGPRSKISLVSRERNGNERPGGEPWCTEATCPATWHASCVCKPHARSPAYARGQKSSAGGKCRYIPLPMRPTHPGGGTQNSKDPLSQPGSGSNVIPPVQRSELDRDPRSVLISPPSTPWVAGYGPDRFPMRTLDRASAPAPGSPQALGAVRASFYLTRRALAWSHMRHERTSSHR